jgi:micrococcal nuclease
LWAIAAVLVVAVSIPALTLVFYRQLETWGSEPAPIPSNLEPGNPDVAWPATVSYVHDGDTLFIEPDDGSGELKVRLIGIDTPEVGENAECYGEEAASLLRSLLPEGAAIYALADRDEFDQFGRSLLYIYAPDGELVNLTMIEEGAAEAVVIGSNDLYADQLFDAEDAARSAGLGMWGQC